MIIKELSFSNSISDFKQYNLFSFIENWDEIDYIGPKNKNKSSYLSNNIKNTFKNGKLILSNYKVICPHCKSSNVGKHGFQDRKLTVKENKEVNISVQRYKCSKCGKTFNADLTEIVDKNCNITKPVIEEILSIYSIHGSSLNKIRYDLKKRWRVDISHQSIQNMIIKSKIPDEDEFWTYSGYYLFDSLWTKINGKWKYILALFDLKLNTIVSFDIASNESQKTIYNFLDKSTRNQNRISITTDLKREYRLPIARLGFKHQLCKFHTKKMLNNKLDEYIKKNNCNNNVEKEFRTYMQEIFKILDCKSYEKARKKLNKLINKKERIPEFISNILWKSIVPYFKNFTYCLENKNISSTSNKIENSFKNIFPKSIKKTIRTVEGVKRRFQLKLNYWETNNKKTLNPQSF